MKKIVIIGAGASGLMAAAQSAKNKDNEVYLIEKMDRPGRKIYISGKGRCNVTNECYQVEELLQNVLRNPRFLYSSFSSFMPYDMVDFLNDLGVETKVERGNRVFLVSDKASDIVDALVSNAKNSGVKIINDEVKDIIIHDGSIEKIVLNKSGDLYCDKLAICTGGLSYPATGSTGDGYKFARKAGHNIIKPKPALVPLKVYDASIKSLQGLSLRNVSFSVTYDGKRIYNDFGEMLFTHFGISGPVVLSASSNLEYEKMGEYIAHIDLKPALDKDVLDDRILRDFSSNINRQFSNALDKLLPKKIIPEIIKRSGIAKDTKINQITKQQRERLVSVIKDFEFVINDFMTIDCAIVTSGGVDTKEINPKTMQSKIIDNLYFAGEVIDVDAYTGGFNLQIAFSTGFVCGNNM